MIEFLKTIHIISVISWMAGLLYLPRIFVYHAEKDTTKEMSDTFKIMEKKLYHYIMTPAAGSRGQNDCSIKDDWWMVD